MYFTQLFAMFFRAFCNTIVDANPNSGGQAYESLHLCKSLQGCLVDEGLIVDRMTITSRQACFISMYSVNSL